MNSASINNQPPTGAALAKARRRAGLMVGEAARQLRISAQVLGEYERELRTPSPAFVKEMARLYDFKPGQLATRMPATRVVPRFDPTSGILWVGWFAIHRGDEGNDKSVQSLALALRSLRGLDEDAPVHLRSDELHILAELFNLGDSELPALLMRRLKIPLTDAVAVIDKMAKSALVMPNV